MLKIAYPEKLNLLTISCYMKFHNLTEFKFSWFGSYHCIIEHSFSAYFFRLCTIMSFMNAVHDISLCMHKFYYNFL